MMGFYMALAGVQQTLSVVVSPSSIIDASPTCPLTTPLATALVVGGRLPYSYLWTQESGGPGITINNPTLKSTSFSTGSPGSHIGTFRCTVTDQNGFFKFDDILVDVECGGV